jgi:periplasmic protein TonB
MFEQTFVQTGKTNKTWTVVVSALIQVGLLIVAVILPMVYFDVLPAATLSSFLVAPPPPPPPPPPPAAAPVIKQVKIIPRQFDAGKLMTPKAIPKEIAVIKEDELPPAASGVGGVVGGVPGGVAGGAPGGVLGSILTQTNALAPPPPPPPPPKKAEAPPPPKRLQIGGNVQAALLIDGPKPTYPPLAKQARISGVVHLHAFISKEGTIQSLSVIPPAHPLLAPAALEAVRRWRYKPTLLNGEPVEVETTIDVSFMLSQ